MTDAGTRGLERRRATGRARSQAGMAQEAAARGGVAAQHGGACCGSAACTPSARARSAPTWASASARARRPSSSWATSARGTAASAGSPARSPGPLDPERAGAGGRRRRPPGAAARGGHVGHPGRPARRRRRRTTWPPSGPSGRRRPAATIEVLVPDFARRPRRCRRRCWPRGPDVFNHNLETVPRLYPQVRPQAVYERSLAVLRQAAAERRRASSRPGSMVGLGETRRGSARGARATSGAAGVDVVTIGQYLRPSSCHLPVVEYVHPDDVRAVPASGARALGLQVHSAPFVRSSFHAGESFARGEGGGAADSRRAARAADSRYSVPDAELQCADLRGSRANARMDWPSDPRVVM